MSSSRRWTSASSAELPGRSPLHPAALSPLRQSSRRSVSKSDAAPLAGAASVARALWPSSGSSSSSSGESKNGKKAPRAPSPLNSSASQSSSTSSLSVATLADHLAKDDTAPVATRQSLSRQRSCTELPRFADDADAEARKIGKKGGSSHTFSRSMRFLPSTKPAGVTLTPGRVAPSDLRRLAGAASLDAGADVASSGSECSDASRSSATARTASSKPRSPLLPRTGSVRLLGSSNTQWALSPGRRSVSPLKTTTTLASVPETKCKKSLISLGWGHLFNRRKHATDDASLAAAAATLLSSPLSSRSGRGRDETGHQMKMAHCRLLQWRYANAWEDAARKRKLASAEVELMGTWTSVSELRGKVVRKRVQLEKEKLKLKLDTVLSSQMKFLESWEYIESKHGFALTSTVGCTRAAVCRVPLTNGAEVSMPSLASNLQHAVELVITTKTTTRPFGPTTTSVVPELVRVARKERTLLQECLELLRQFSSLQVKEQSLRCHLVQTSSLATVAVEL